MLVNLGVTLLAGVAAIWTASKLLSWKKTFGCCVRRLRSGADWPARVDGGELATIAEEPPQNRSCAQVLTDEYKVSWQEQAWTRSWLGKTKRGQFKIDNWKRMDCISYALTLLLRHGNAGHGQPQWYPRRNGSNSIEELLQHPGLQAMCATPEEICELITKAENNRFHFISDRGQLVFQIPATFGCLRSIRVGCGQGHNKEVAAEKPPEATKDPLWPSVRIVVPLQHNEMCVYSFLENRVQSFDLAVQLASDCENFKMAERDQKYFVFEVKSLQGRSSLDSPVCWWESVRVRANCFDAVLLKATPLEEMCLCTCPEDRACRADPNQPKVCYHAGGVLLFLSKVERPDNGGESPPSSVRASRPPSSRSGAEVEAVPRRQGIVITAVPQEQGASKKRRLGPIPPSSDTYVPPGLTAAGEQAGETGST